MNASSEPSKVAKSFVDGILTGCFSTFIFNPVDKALYEMVRDQKSIFDPSLWRHPYNGVGLALYGRIVGYGIYFSFFDLYKERFKSVSKHQNVNLLIASVSTGLTSVALTHPINLIKIYYWNHKTSLSLLGAGKELYTKWGWKFFLRGLEYTCLRDVLFSTTFFMLSKRNDERPSFIKDTIVTSCATAVAAVPNFFRNRHFFDFDERPPSIGMMVNEVKVELQKKPQFYQKVNFIFHERLNVGLGTLRVGIGMAIANQVYNYLKHSSYMDEC